MAEPGSRLNYSDWLLAALWALIISAHVTAPLLLRGHRTLDARLLIAAIWLVGPMVAALICFWLVKNWFRNKPRSARFAALFVALASSTAAFTGLPFVLHYRLYYSKWHGATFELEWLIQQLFTTANALYLFGASGLYKMVTPLSVAALMGICWFATRSARGLQSGN